MMKNLFAVFAIFMCVGVQITQAQFGIKGGVNIASLLQESQELEVENLNDNAITGLQLGVFFPIAVSSSFIIQPEVLYIQKGGKSSYDIPVINQRIENKIFMNYIEIPVMAKALLGGGDNRFFVEAGPFAGFALNGKEELVSTNLNTEESSSTERTFSFDDQDNQQRLDYGFSVGAGFELGRLVLNARYNLGVNNLLDEDANNNNDNKPVMNTRGVSLTAGILF